jgi:hypothetical protein
MDSNKSKFYDPICFDSSIGHRSAFASCSIVSDFGGTPSHGLDATSSRSERVGVWWIPATFFGWIETFFERTGVAQQCRSTSFCLGAYFGVFDQSSHMGRIAN